MSTPSRVRVDYVAERLGVTARTVNEKAARGEILGAAKIGKFWTFDKDKIEKYLVLQEIASEGLRPPDAFDRFVAGELSRADLRDGDHAGRDLRVYIIGYGPYVKIGMSESAKGSRVKTLQTGAPQKLVVYAHLRGGRKLEAALHKKFKTYRLEGEWFRKRRMLAEWIEAGCPVTMVSRRDGVRYEIRPLK